MSEKIKKMAKDLIENCNFENARNDLIKMADEKEAAGKKATTTRRQIDAVDRFWEQINSTTDEKIKKHEGIFNIDHARNKLPGASEFRILVKMAMQARYGSQNPRGLSINCDYINGKMEREK